MAATIEDLDFIAPGVAGMAESDKTRALQMAAAYRPGCLTEAKQDEAQLWYAAWLLYGRLQHSGGAAPVLAGVKSYKEGDLAITYGSAAETADPMGYLGRWQVLNDLCGYGAITVGRPLYGCCPRH